ncbi:hypothetical protein ABK040_016854 [Willaertia magna]
MCICCIDQLPSELFVDILSFLPLKDIISIFLISKQYYNQFNNNSLLFYTLCKNICKIHKISAEIDKIQQKNEEGIDYKKSLQNLIENYLSYQFNTNINYYNEKDYNECYTISNNNHTLSVLAKPKHGEFITLCSNKEFKKGNLYKTIFKLNEYNPNAISNNFKIMVGVESKYFFPWTDQSSGDVIAWQSSSYGAAFIVGQLKQLTQAYSPIDYKLNGIDYNYLFKSGDCIVMEVDLTKFKDLNKDLNNDQKMEEELNELNEMEEIYEYKNGIERDKSAKIRFSVFDCHLKKLNVGEWIEFGNSQITYVPSVSVNMGQTISIYGTEHAAGISIIESE